jgi:CelD/BcsL family acetyltransferase involved in cellulose biosynthesis
MGQSADATLARAMHARVHDDASSFAKLAPRWREVLELDPATSVFQTPQYLATWHAEFGSERGLRILEMSGDGDSARAMAALTIGADGVLQFAGDLDTTDYQGPVSAPEDRESVAATIFETMDAEPWRSFELTGLAADTGWPEAFTAAAKSAGHEVSDGPLAACPRVAIPGSFEAYLAALPGKLRHEMLRKARRLEREAGAFAIRLANEETLDDDLERFFAMHRTSEGPKGHFMHEGMATFFGSFAWMLFSQGWLRLAFLEIGEEPWAGAFGFSYRGTWGVWNSAYDHRRRELSPGMVLMSECIRLAAAEGSTTFDLLRGTEPYKYRFGAVDVPVVQMTVVRG